MICRSCLQKCLPFQYEPSKRLPVQSQQLEQSLKYVYIVIDIVNIEYREH